MAAPYNLPTDINHSKGFQELIVYVQQEVPIFIPLFLFSVFVIIMLSGYNSERRRTGSANAFMWFSIAGHVTLAIAFVLQIIPGLVSLNVLLIVFVVEVVGIILFLTSRDQ